MEKRDNIKADLVKKIAVKHNLTERSVYRIIAGEQENQDVFDDYMLLREEFENIIENYKTSPLLNAVKDLVKL